MEKTVTTGLKARVGTENRLIRGISIMVLAGSLAACDLGAEINPLADRDMGFKKVPNRERESIRSVAKPNPPPVVAGIGGPAGGEVPKLAANAPAGVTQAMVEEGAKHFGTVCGACHGAGGAGSAAGPTLNDSQWLNITGQYNEIVTVINTGVLNPKQYPGAMPPKGGGNFNDQQVRELAAYVFALSHQ